MIWHTASLDEIYVALHTDPQNGRTEYTVDTDRFTPKADAPSLWWEIWYILRRPTHIAAMAGIGVTVAAAIYDSILYGSGDWITPVALLLLTGVHTLLCALPFYLQKRFDAQVTLHTAHTARLRHNHTTQSVPSGQLRPGDIIELCCGDVIAADCRLIDCRDLYCDESAVDGAALSEEKRADRQLPASTPFSQRVNMVYAGSSVLRGSGVAVVVQAGEDTRLAQLQAAQRHLRTAQTPEGRRLDFLLRYSAIAAAILSVSVAVIGILQYWGLPLLLTTAALTVFAAIPSGVSAAEAWVRYATVQRCQAGGALLRTGHAYTRAAHITLLCAATAAHKDITLVKLAAEKAYAAVDQPLPEALQYLLQLAVLSLSDGRQTDPAAHDICACARKNGAVQEQLLLQYPREAALPYNTAELPAAAVHLINGRHMLIVRQDVALLEGCEMSEGLRQSQSRMEREGLSVQAVVCRMTESVPPLLTADDCLRGGAVVGLLGFRKKADSIACRAVPGVRVVSFTEGEGGSTLNAYPDEIPDSQLDASAWSGLSAEERERLVRAYRRAGHTVAVLGGSVLDVPAMRAANLALADIGSQEAAKQAADVLLTDTAGVAACLRHCKKACAVSKNSAVYRLLCSYGVAAAAVLCLLITVPLPPACILLALTLSVVIQVAGVLLGGQGDGSLLRSPLRHVAVGAVSVAAAALLGALSGSAGAGAALSMGIVLRALCVHSAKPLRLPSLCRYPLFYAVGAIALVLAATPLFFVSCTLPSILCVAVAGCLPAAAHCIYTAILLKHRNREE